MDDRAAANSLPGSPSPLQVLRTLPAASGTVKRGAGCRVRGASPSATHLVFAAMMVILPS